MQKIIPYLWFDSQAEEAANLYVSLFKESRIKSISRYSDESAAVSGRPKGSAMTIAFELQGQSFIALNGGPLYKLSPAISLLTNCETQEEIDTLGEGGQAQRCGWLTDRFGVTWQIVPAALNTLMSGPDPKGAGRVMQALLQMKKIDIEGLKKAYEGR